MKPVLRTIDHKPAEGRYGDCFRAACASMLEIPIEEMPHVYDDGRTGAEAMQMLDDFLAPRGLLFIELPLVPAHGVELEDVLGLIAERNGDGFTFIFSGTSRNGFHHSVIARGGEIIHDTNPNGAWIVAPCDDGAYWIGVFADRRISA